MPVPFVSRNCPRTMGVPLFLTQSNHKGAIVGSTRGRRAGNNGFFDDVENAVYNQTKALTGSRVNDHLHLIVVLRPGGAGSAPACRRPAGLWLAVLPA